MHLWIVPRQLMVELYCLKQEPGQSIDDFFFPHMQYLWDQISLYEPTWIMHAMPKILWISGSTEKVFSFAFNWKSFQGACIRGNIYIYKSYYLGLVTQSWPYHPLIHLQCLQFVRMSTMIALALSDPTLDMIILTSAPSVGYCRKHACVTQSSASMANINSILLHPPTPSPDTSSFGKSSNSCLH